MDDIERDLEAALHSHAGRLLALKVGPRLDSLVAASVLNPQGKTAVLSAFTTELSEAAPRWADDLMDRLRRLLRLPDDD